MAVYGVLAVLSAIENVVPPVPSDGAVALGAILSAEGVTRPLAVFLVTWLANLAGAVGVYLAARRYGRRLFSSGIGRRLLAPRSLAIIEREYLRFGVVGIFVIRLLPGIRAVGPPFAGLVSLSLLRFLVPTGLAAALWYGGIILLVSFIGAEWDHINQILANVNQTLSALTVAVILLGIAGFLEARRRRRRDRVWHATKDALDPAAPSFLAGSELAEGSARQMAALLVLELAYADSALTEGDRELVTTHLRQRWGLDPVRFTPPEPEHERRTRFAHYAARLRSSFAQSERLALVERMWTVAFSDGTIDRHEERLMHLAGELLGLRRDDVTEVRARLQEKVGT